MGARAARTALAALLASVSFAAALFVPAVLAPALLLLAACSDSASNGSGDEKSRLDPRVAYLRHWVALRRPSDGARYFLARFEFREEDARDALAIAGRVPKKAPSGQLPDLPVANVLLPEAIEFAKAYWGRLPRFEEWRAAVEGEAGHRFPWGEDDGSRLHANTMRLGLLRRTRVGTFESGRDRGRLEGCHDLFGNVAEWTLTPWAELAIDREVRRPETGGLGEVFDRSGAFDVIVSSQFGVWSPWGSMTPYLPELLPSVLSHDPAVDVRFCSVGFSHSQRQPLRHEGRPYWERLGVVPLSPADRRWDVGLRLATDAWSFVSGLERADGQPRGDDATTLRDFVRRYREDFLPAAKLWLSLDRKALNLRPIGPWAEIAYAALGLR